MCVLVDANAVHKLFKDDEVGAFLMEQIAGGKTHLITGGKHKQELLKAGLHKMYRELVLAGRLIEYDERKCGVAEKAYAALAALTSDDPHIIGLADVSGCRLLFSYDDALCNDFRNPAVLPKPRGRLIRHANPELVKRAPRCRDA